MNIAAKQSMIVQNHNIKVFLLTSTQGVTVIGTANIYTLIVMFIHLTIPPTEIATHIHINMVI